MAYPLWNAAAVPKHKVRLATMPQMLGEKPKTTMPVADGGAVTLLAQNQPENGVTGMPPAQDPGDSLEQNILSPAGQDEALAPLSELPAPADDSDAPQSQSNNAAVFVPNQGAAFTPFVDGETLSGLEISGGALDATEATVESTDDPIHDEFLPADLAAAPNRAPIADPQTATTDEESAASGAVTATDPDGDPLTFSLASGPASGIAVVNADGTFTYTPGAAFQSLPVGASATDSFTVLVDDGRGGTATATVTVTINGVNDAPVTADVAVAGDEDSKISGSVVSSDIDGDPLIHSLDSGPSLGSATVNADGTFTYTPGAALQSLPAGGSATDSFTVLVDDGNGGTTTSIVTVTINGVNDTPVTADVGVAGDEDNKIGGTVVSSDIDGDTLIHSLGSGPSLGSAIVNTDGTFTYTPGAALQSLPAGGSATDSFTVLVDDGNGGTATATVTVTINGINDAPVTGDVTVAGDEDSKILGTVISSDIDGDKLTHSLDSGPSLGSATVNADGSFEYTPDASLQSLPVGASATDSFTVLVDDGKGGTATATVTVTINGVNDAPVVAGESFIVSDGTPFTAPTSKLLANDSDIEGEALSITAVGNMVNASASLGAGSVTFSGTSAGAASFDYTVSDVSGGNSVATVSLTVLHTDDGDNNLAIPSAAGIDALIDGRGGNDQLTAGGGDDTLLGGSGNDTLSGGAGTDSLAGGMGDDSYVVDGVTDIITETAGQGTDTVLSSVTFTIVPLPEIENLTLTGAANTNGTGNDANNVITGNSGKNSLVGGIGNDTLEGGAGIDSLVGGTGNDSFVVDSTTDVITELAGGGTDTVRSSVTFSIAALAQIENLTLTGTANINGTGNNLNNVITGNSGNNALNGGNGIDTLIGGAGNDTFTVNTLTDKLVENAGEGTDTVSSSVTFDLNTVANIENLTLTGAAALNGTGDNNANSITGNTGANLLIGNGGNDTLTGGTGVDTMRGGLGNDIYVIGTTFVDVIEENAGEGVDTINAQMTFDLTSVANIENLTLVNGGSFNGFGDGGDNRVNGNSGNNSLDGRDGDDTLTGAAGTDTLIGGNGNDVYVVDSTGDKITELAGGGTDRVESTVSFTIAAQPDVENLTLTGTGNINGTGNTGDNVITGNDGKNNLSGGDGADTLSGGLGNDTLTGGNGNDRFDGGTGVDRLVFGAGNDTAIFTSLLQAGDIVTGFNKSGADQDFVDLDGLFDTLGVAAGARAGRVILIGAGANTQLWIDSDGNATADVQLLTFTGVVGGLTAGTAATDDIQVGA